MEQKFEHVPPASRGLRLLYNTVPGRSILKLLTAPWLSNSVGHFMDHRVSRMLVPGFVKKNGIDLSEYLPENYACFNDCFCRRIRPELRPVDMDPAHLASPCDGLLSVYPIDSGQVIPVKQSRYTIAELLENGPLAKEFEGGTCLVFRLCVNHYHRYTYPDSGTKGENIDLPGILHTVRPIALEHEPVFLRNSREYTVLDSDHFGRVVQMEVGAMLVGKIQNLHGPGTFLRGQEKGCFLYGGSTVILLLQKGKLCLEDWVARSSSPELEIPVKLGECIGIQPSKDS